ncbi:hypothetical protein DU478_18870 [Thalassococcus profundi]|uniref:Alpha/beta hydrolase fold-3 domain-containing protein n=1 Tax=Thalassococcus profundi TaxID=2282382 RepID=A0A369TII2_9RHOB|nr:alpha/beta hydrolase fold domain-containing protein [Thalassococcus profundi]RDD64632.1 hypothetical protein DU478_18870 [Thalassococcus profundi]
MNRADIAARVEAHPVKGTPDEMRAAFRALAPDGPWGRRDCIGGVPVVIHGTESGNDGTILFLHGGGYVFGDATTHAAAAACLAELTGDCVILPEYRLAPEHPWPAPLNDACAVLNARDGPISVVGDSAGGHLALSLTLARPGRVDALALISPNTDRTGLSRTRDSNSAHDLMNSDADDAALGALAFGDRHADDPAVSPLLSDLSGLPPLYLTATTTEVLLDDTLLFARAAARAGVRVTLKVEPDLFHMWTLWPAWPPARRSWAGVAQALSR